MSKNLAFTLRGHRADGVFHTTLDIRETTSQDLAVAARDLLVVFQKHHTQNCDCPLSQAVALARFVLEQATGAHDDVVEGYAS